MKNNVWLPSRHTVIYLGVIYPGVIYYVVIYIEDAISW
jgi:hypothetical protein